MASSGNMATKTLEVHNNPYVCVRACVLASIQPVFSYVCGKELGIRKSRPHLHPGNPEPYPPISSTRRLRTKSSVPALVCPVTACPRPCTIGLGTLCFRAGDQALVFVEHLFYSNWVTSPVRTHARVLVMRTYRRCVSIA